MQKMKRIEVLLPDALVQRFTEQIEQCQYQTYTISGGLSGRNRQGAATPGLSDASVTILCLAEEAQPMIATVERFLTRYGGIGSVIDAQGINVG